MDFVFVYSMETCNSVVTLYDRHRVPITASCILLVVRLVLPNTDLKNIRIVNEASRIEGCRHPGDNISIIVTLGYFIARQELQ